MTNSLAQHIPAATVAYCQQLWQHYQFNLRIVKPRRTRLGDFRVLPDRTTQITINADLNLYAFLITYVHEVAHADVHRNHKRRTQPHGKAWQTAFQRLMSPLLTENVFPLEILHPLMNYMSSPAATTYANPALMLALRQADARQSQSATSNRMLLKDVPEGNSFQLAKKTFVRGTLRRTRVVCKEISSGKSYAILAHAWVENTDL
ncbi:sprT domain-containing protein [Spirosoma soli]|uniref:SprT domain-containing protein n=1 Tax=Spirosoma soli TaxID=1770529 RepID=A0ABW5M679_9BACT